MLLHKTKHLLRLLCLWLKEEAYWSQDLDWVLTENYKYTGSHFSDDKQISAISLGFACLNYKEITLAIKMFKNAFERQASVLIH
jgi:hypothetical protein